MASHPRSGMRLTVLAVLTGFAAALGAAASDSEEPAGLSKVEYVWVASEGCLQPVVYDDAVEPGDFRLAAARWLSETYPAFQALSWQTQVVRPSDPDADATATGLEYKREAVRLQKADGGVVAVCFDINRKAHTGGGTNGAARSAR